MASRQFASSWGEVGVIAFVSLPFIVEVVRKYAIPSNVVLIAGESIALLVAAIMVARVPLRVLISLMIFLIATVCWKLVSIIIGHQDLALGMVGLRGFLVPCAFLIVSVAIYHELGIRRTAALTYNSFTIWLIVIGVVMTLQLVLDRDHWINALPEGFGDERGGIGDYTVGEKGLSFLFRPTGIFLHTGKVGAVLFVLATFRLFYAHAIGKSHWVLAAGIVLDVVAIALSGQRAAMLGYAIALLIVFSFRVRKAFLYWLAAITIGGSAALAASSSVITSEVGEFLALVAERFLSGISEVPIRINENLIAPAEAVWDEFGLLPAGTGAFSLGSAAFGGKPLYEVVSVGTAENSWLRLLAEEGFVGVVSSMLFWCGLLFVAVCRAMKKEPTGEQDARLFRYQIAGAAFILGVLLLWANTHDILGNTQAMSLCMMLLGSSLAGRRRSGKKPSAEMKMFPVVGELSQTSETVRS